MVNKASAVGVSRGGNIIPSSKLVEKRGSVEAGLEDVYVSGRDSLGSGSQVGNDSTVIPSVTEAGKADSDFIPAGRASKEAWMIGPWVKSKRPVLVPSKRPENFDSRNVYNMATIKEDGMVKMIYRGESLSEPAGSMTGRFGLAVSKDGVNFSRYPTDEAPRPILEPTEPYESHGIEDPRLVKLGDTYVLTYTGYDGKMGRLCLATSKDMIHWDKKGPLFPDFKQGGCPLVPDSPPGATKSGAILPQRLEKGPYAGKYIMLFGDTTMHLAVSEDGVHWAPVAKPVLEPRWDKFDSLLVESGPPLLMTKKGILVIYNSAGHSEDPPEGLSPEEKARYLFPQRKYAVGMALLDPEDPTKVIARTDEPILEVTEDWEKKGYVDNVVFAEGLVKVGDEWLLHYGGADHVIGVAKAPFDPELGFQGRREDAYNESGGMLLSS